ncbi:tetratricopeptide repeat protein [Clostridium botulinum]|uniref:TPR domain protein n=2 Tax=Clostridium TaxID=1485 RepID=B1IIR0_CLOBK|nr:MULTISPECIES: tetratricopeptide repeat protein [Clostridium]ACA44885.1 TPR domain protein [Clostridium botulinum B1 str. Okra]MBD5562744.1 tetratricopeptide repeat protein [Clostridium botulinum]MBD5565622.1 tetratricopeptide repeat protein [Clostridium botulinum]MBD5569861.1 tetratricopeptide repeat protein [Clostridium botulinum]MBD5573343.1 tetratricopeptide repeat protein [Clostridium botulinum]
MNSHRKKYFLIFFISGLVLIFVSFISYNYGKNVVIKNFIKSGDVYINKKEYIKAIAIYEEVVKYDRNDTDKNMLKLATSMQNSRKSYHDGMIYYNRKQYLKALKCFRQVMENDTIAFNKAQEKIKECTEKYIEDNLKNAEKSIHNFKYREASEYLNNIFKLDKDNEEAKKLKDILNKKYFN